MFTNAQEQAKEHPDTFQIPTQEEIKEIKLGDNVKICTEGERFWARVIDISSSGEVIGSVNNDLELTYRHDLSFGDIVTFRVDNIYDISD